MTDFVVMDVAREYVRLGLRFNRLEDGLVDAFTGDPTLRQDVEAEPAPDPAQLRAQASALLAELPSSGLAEDRAAFLWGQLTALECAARRRGGEHVTYLDEVEAYYQVRPQPGDTCHYAELHDQLDELVPGTGGLVERFAAYRRAGQCPPDRLAAAVEALSEALGEQVRTSIGCLPAGESVAYEVVTDRPWSGFNYYLGGYRSRVAVNADLPHRLMQLPHLVAHESYPGHHTANCRKEHGLVRGDGRVEHTLFLVNTPECLIAEGLADLGLSVAVGPGWGRWAQDVLATVGLRLDGELAERIANAAAGLDRARQDAALLLHDQGRGEDEVVAYLSRWLLVPEQRARDSLRFLADPLWRAYTSTYVEGCRLLTAWLDVRPAEQTLSDRFARLLDEPLTPARIAAELPSRADTS